MRRWLGCWLSVGLGTLALGLVLWSANGARAEQAAPNVTLVNATGSLLLVPDSHNNRVMAFDAATGELLDANYVPSGTAQLSSPKNAILNAAGDTILVSDQSNDVVQAFDLAGNYLGVFAPAGGANPNILDNNTGLALRPNGNLLVAVSSLTTTDRVAEFDAAGNYLGNFIAIGSGGLDGPFDIFARGTSEWLVSSIGTDDVRRYNFTTGAFVGVLAGVNNFPQQIALAANNNILVANFGGSQEGILEFTPGGALVDVYTATGLSNYRGVYELPGGNLLVSTSGGVYEISRSSNTIVDTKISDVDAQYIERVEVPVSIVLTKTVGTDQGVCADTSAIGVPALTNVTYCYEVTNTGGMPLTRHDLDDSELGLVLEDFPFTLQPGASAFLTQTVRIRETTINTAEWSAFSDARVYEASATGIATVSVTSTLELDVTVGTNPGTCATTQVITLTAPSKVTYCYEITNGTALSLTRHDLDDSELGIVLNDFPFVLVPGASAFLTQTTLASLTGTTVNTAVWSAFNPGPSNLVTATDQARVVFITRIWLPLILR